MITSPIAFILSLCSPKSPVVWTHQESKVCPRAQQQPEHHTKLLFSVQTQLNLTHCSACLISKTFVIHLECATPNTEHIAYLNISPYLLKFTLSELDAGLCNNCLHQNLAFQISCVINKQKINHDHKDEVHTATGTLFSASILCQLTGEVLHSVHSFLQIQFLMFVMFYILCKRFYNDNPTKQKRLGAILYVDPSLYISVQRSQQTGW